MRVVRLHDCTAEYRKTKKEMDERKAALVEALSRKLTALLEGREMDEANAAAAAAAAARVPELADATTVASAAPMEDEAQKEGAPEPPAAAPPQPSAAHAAPAAAAPPATVATPTESDEAIGEVMQVGEVRTRDRGEERRCQVRVCGHERPRTAQENSVHLQSVERGLLTVRAQTRQPAGTLGSGSHALWRGHQRRLHA